MRRILQNPKSLLLKPLPTTIHCSKIDALIRVDSMLIRCSSNTVIRLTCRNQALRVPSRPWAKPSHSVVGRSSCRYGSSSASSAADAHFTSGTAHVAGASKLSALHPLEDLVDDLDKIAPRFEIDAEDVEILTGPVDFYETLKVCLRTFMLCSLTASPLCPPSFQLKECLGGQ